MNLLLFSLIAEYDVMRLLLLDIWASGNLSFICMRDFWYYSLKTDSDKISKEGL